MTQQASESFSLEQAQAHLPTTELWVQKVMRRLAPFLPDRPLRVLEIGSAQGRGLIALTRLGHRAVGLDPWMPAVQVSQRLGQVECTDALNIGGRAETIPFKDNQFDLVLAFSVMEHVADLGATLREVHRVLRPGGVFWFSSTSSLCPRQNEIRGFPCFGWYPDPLKKYIMTWAVKHKPGLVGHTKTPAMHWWTPPKARKRLGQAGFGEIWDRWDLRAEDEESGIRQGFFNLAKRNRYLRLLGDVVTSGSAYAARKS